MGCQHLDEIFELFLLGAIPREISADVRAHLDHGCPTCLERLREAGKSVHLLAQMIRPGRPNPKWKSDLLRRLKKK